MTITGVTGDVVEVDLLRFYLRELAGVGMNWLLQAASRSSIMRVVSAGTPLYKQMPEALIHGTK